MFDIIIKNGKIIDGSGAKSFMADVAIKGDKISAIGKFNGTEAKKIIDAAGKVVCPGIIDVHSHADLALHKEDHHKILEPLVRQGITTLIGGNCGMAMAPIPDAHKDRVRDYLEAFTRVDFAETVTWKTMAEYFAHLDKKGLLLNAAILTPHSLMRIGVSGLEARKVTEDEIKIMSRQLTESLEAGSFGLSTGLQYFPGSQSDTKELLSLGKLLKKYNGIFTSHLRSYSNTLGEAIKEVVEVAEKSEIPAQISHIFWVPDMGYFGPPVRRVIRRLAQLSKYWTLPIPLDVVVKGQLSYLDEMRKKGVRVMMDVMPTTTGFTHLLAFFPPWALTGNKEAIVERLKDKDMRKKMLKSIEKGKTSWPHVEGDSWSLNLFKIMGWECARIMAVFHEKNKKYEGRSIISLAKELRKHPFDVVCDLLIEEEGKVLIFESMAHTDDNFTERSMFAPIKHPEVAISTDTILMGFGKPSPLFYACYPKFISRYVREKKMLSEEVAIRKISGLPATHFGIKERGFIRENYFADILIFDLEKIKSLSSFHNPEVYPSGIEHVIINGYHILEKNNIYFDALPGRLLRRN